MSNIISRGTAPVLFNKDQIDQFFGMLGALAQQGYAGVSDNWTEVFKQESMNEQSINRQEMYGIGSFAEVAEGVTPSVDKPGVGYKSTFVHAKYASGIAITQEALDDNKKYPEFANMAQHLGSSARYTEIQLAWNYLNNYSSKTTADGLALFSTAHLVPRTGGTFGNRVAAPVSLSETSIQAMWNLQAKMVDPSGRTNPITGMKLIIPVDLHWVAQVLFGTDKKIGGNANDINTVSGSRVVKSVVESPFLTSATTHFYRTDMDGLSYFTRKPFYTKNDEKVGAETKYMYGYFSSVIGAWDARAIMADGPALA